MSVSARETNTVLRSQARRCGVRRWGAAVAVVIGVVVTVPLANAVETGPPAGLVWVGRAPDTQTSTLYRAGPGGVVRRSALPYSLNAIGCGPDGSVYGLAASRKGERFADGPHPVRVRPNGGVDDLGPVAADGRHPLATGYAAALRAGPGPAITLVVAAGTELREVRLTPGRPTLTTSKPLPGNAFIGDWALDGHGDLVAVTGSGGRAALLRLSANGLRPNHTVLPGLPTGSNYGGAAMSPDGSLYVVYHRPTRRGTIYRVSPTGTARAVSTVDPAESTDAAMCPTPKPRTASAVPASGPAPSPSSVPPVPPARPAAVHTRVHEPEPPPTGPAPGPRPPTPTRPRPAKRVAAPGPERLITTRTIPVVGVVLLGAVVAVRLIRRPR